MPSLIAVFATVDPTRSPAPYADLWPLTPGEEIEAETLAWQPVCVACGHAWVAPGTPPPAAWLVRRHAPERRHPVCRDCAADPETVRQALQRQHLGGAEVRIRPTPTLPRGSSTG